MGTECPNKSLSLCYTAKKNKTVKLKKKLQALNIFLFFLTGIGPFEEECIDFVSVEDSNGHTLVSTCEQVDLPIRLTSTTDTVEIVVEAKSKGAFPKRGVLLHYKSKYRKMYLIHSKHRDLFRNSTAYES